MAEKFLSDEAQLNRLKGMMSVGAIFEMMREDIVRDYSNEIASEIARKLLKRGISVEAVCEDTGLLESTILSLRKELEDERK